MVHVLFAAGAGDGGEFHVQRLEVVAQAFAAHVGLQALFQHRVLRGHAHRAFTGVAMVAKAGRCAQRFVLRQGAHVLAVVHIARRIATQRNQHALAQRDGVCAHCECFGHIGSGADAAGDDELHLADHVQVFQCVHRLAQRCQRRDADVFNETGLRRCGAALHAIDHDHVGTGVDRQLDVVEGTGRAHFHVNRFFPIGDFTQLVDLDGQVIRAGPVRLAAGGTLVHALGQGAHFGHARVDLLAQQHAAAAGFSALADHDFNRVGAAHVIGVKAVARRQALVNQGFRGVALLAGHAAVAGGGGGAHFGRGAPQRLFHVG